MRAIVRAADGAVRHRPGGLLLLSALLLVLVVSARAQTPDWTVPDDAATLTSPLSATPEVARRGDELFAARCKKCHGAEGRGDGPYSDPKHPAADLTQPEVAATPDGILFYKIWNGRRPMPAFKTDLEKNDVWALVAHVKMLGTPAPASP